MCTKPQLKLVIATRYCLHHMIFLHHVTKSDAICKQIWLLCVCILNLNSLWSHGNVYTIWFLFTWYVLTACYMETNLAAMRI